MNYFIIMYISVFDNCSTLCKTFDIIFLCNLLQEDPGPIVLNTDSLRQFSDTLDYDFDAVVSQAKCSYADH